MNNKELIKKTLSISVLVITFALFVYYIYNHASDFRQISLINPLWLTPLIVLFLASYYFTGLQTKVLLKPLGVRLKNIEVYMLSIVTGFYNIITPAHGGMGVRAVYLKKKHNFTYINFLSSLAGMYVITFFIASLSGLISFIYIYRVYNIFNWIILAVLLGLFIPLGLIILVSPKFKETKSNFINRFIKVANGWNLIRKNKKVVYFCLLVTILNLIIGSVGAIISYHIFGINLSFMQALFLTSIGSISLLVSITPGNLGVGEAVVVFSALILGITPTQSLSVAILSRIIQMISLFTLGPIFSYKLLKEKPGR